MRLVDARVRDESRNNRADVRSDHRPDTEVGDDDHVCRGRQVFRLQCRRGPPTRANQDSLPVAHRAIEDRGRHIVTARVDDEVGSVHFGEV
jgi:hypothetical protein